MCVKRLFLNGNGDYFIYYCYSSLYRCNKSQLVNERSTIGLSYDVTTNQTAAANQLSYMLNQRQIEHDYNYKELIYTHLYKNKLFNSDTARPYYVNVTSAAFFLIGT